MNIHYQISKIVQMQQIDGCGNHSCIFKKPVGQGTNGPCGCRDHIASKILDFISKNKQDFMRQLEYMEDHPNS